MGRSKRSGRVELEGLVCWLDDDPLAEVSLVTDGGRELPIEPGGPIDDPSRWVDVYVHVYGRYARRDDRRYLRVDRVERVQDEWDYAPAHDAADWPADDYRWDDGEDEYEDFH